jgi:transposase
MTANRRQYTAEFKAKVVLEVLNGEKTPSEVCRSHKLNANVLNRWRKEFVEQAPSIFGNCSRRLEPVSVWQQ